MGLLEYFLYFCNYCALKAKVNINPSLVINDIDIFYCHKFDFAQLSHIVTVNTLFLVPNYSNSNVHKMYNEVNSFYYSIFISATVFVMHISIMFWINFLIPL